MENRGGYFAVKGKVFLSFFLLFIFLVFTFGFWSYYERGVSLHEASSLEGKFDSALMDISRLQEERSVLERELDSAQTDILRFKEERSVLESARLSLENRLLQASSDYENLSSDYENLSSEHSILSKANTALQERLKDISDLNLEDITVLKSEISNLESQIISLEDDNASLQDRLKNLSGTDGGTISDLESEIVRLETRITFLASENRRLESINTGLSSSEDTLSAENDVLSEDLRRRLNELRLIENQNANLRLRLRRLNVDLAEKSSALSSAVSSQTVFIGGIDLPACWSHEDGVHKGKPEYLFDIDLTRNGIVIFDRSLPHRSEAFSFLPHISIPRNEALSSEDFLSVTSDLFSWSTDKSCRFFVRICDRTPDNDKSLYKNLLRSLESRFYKYERSDSDCGDL